jgi:hypothetical protein
MISRFQTFMPDDAPDAPGRQYMPLEHVEISCKTIKFIYAPQKTDGSMDGNVQAGLGFLRQQAGLNRQTFLPAGNALIL